MGYTHYFGNKGHKDDEKNFLKVVEEAKKLYESMPATTDTAGGFRSNEPLILCGGDGTGKPEFTKEFICFNGDESTENDHEGFYVPNSRFSDFCKTARKPYDLMVCAVLISCKKHLPNFTLGSDGWIEDWEPAHKFYNEICKPKDPDVRYVKPRPVF